jgi:hypothetical protein
MQKRLLNMITYEQWRNDIFGQDPSSDPVTAELLEETYSVSKEEALDYIDQALTDPTIHTLFSKEQIGIGLNILYSNSCSDFPFSYIQGGDENRRVVAIRNLQYLYSKFFEKYCTFPVHRIGYDLDDGRIGFLCYMLWDIFVLYPGNATKSMIDAAVNVMRDGLKSTNDNCIVSVIHGLGHWASDVPSIRDDLGSWIRNPTTNNEAVLRYAAQAQTGCIQ